MDNKERYNIAEMLETLTTEQKKDFLSFLQTLQAQEQQHRASADTDTTTAPGTDRAEQSSQAQHDTSTAATDAAPDNLSKEPHTIEEARKRIRLLYLPDVTTQPAGLYLQAIMEYLDSALTYSNLELAILMSYSAGVQHGKHIERAKKKQRASLQQ